MGTHSFEHVDHLPGGAQVGNVTKVVGGVCEGGGQNEGRSGGQNDCGQRPRRVLGDLLRIESGDRFEQARDVTGR